jgi:hypothetical protein
VLVTASTETETLDRASADVVLVRQRASAPRDLREGRDYDWDVVIRAGRTDPAPCVDDATLATDDPRVEAWAAALRDRRTISLPG